MVGGRRGANGVGLQFNMMSLNKMQTQSYHRPGQ